MLPTCQNCYEKWSWKETLKRSITLTGVMTCPYCTEKQYLSASYKKKSSFYFTLPILFVFIVNLLFELSISTAIIIAFIFVMIILGLNPLLMELSNEEEPLF